MARPLRIEFPLPDTEGQRKLIRLYAPGLVVPEEVMDAIVQKT